MNHLQVGLLPLARTTFDIPLAEKIWREASRRLDSAGFSVLGPEALITSLDSAQEAAADLRGTPLDLLVVLQATFADSTMVTVVAEQIEAPICLWAVPEERTGARLRLNSLCGINLAGHALTLRCRRYDYIYASPEDPAVLETLAVLASAGQVVRRLRSTRLGVFGSHPDGMDTCHLDAPLLREKLGVEIMPLELKEVFLGAAAVTPARLSEALPKFKSRLAGLKELPEEPLQGTVRAYAAMKQITEENELAGLAVRCWPEFFTDLGCAACGAMSMLSDENIPCSCEADINGTITQLILQWLSGDARFWK